MGYTLDLSHLRTDNRKSYLQTLPIITRVERVCTIRGKSTKAPIYVGNVLYPTDIDWERLGLNKEATGKGYEG